MTTDLQKTPAGAPAGTPPPVGAAAGRALMLVVGFVLIAAGVAGALLLLGDTSVRVEQSATAHPVVDRVVLDLRANGDVEVAVHDADEILVEQRVETTISQVEVSQRIDGDDLVLASTRCQRGLALFFNRCSASFVVRVPASTTVVGAMSHGALTIVGIDGPAEVRTEHGRTDAIDVAGGLTLRTGHGRVSVQRAAGEIAIDTGHGRIDFAPASPPTAAELTTSHGDVNVLLPDDAPTYAVTTNASGRQANVHIATDPAADHRLEVRTGHGRIDIDYANS